MNETRPPEEEVPAADQAHRRKVSEWWDSLTTKAKKAVLRKRERTETKKARRAARLVTTHPAGYQCPRCWAWFRTPTERRDHRTTHRQVGAAP